MCEEWDIGSGIASGGLCLRGLYPERAYVQQLNSCYTQLLRLVKHNIVHVCAFNELLVWLRSHTVVWQTLQQNTFTHFQDEYKNAQI